MPEIAFSAPLVLKSGFRLPSRVMLSPMEGVTTPAFVRAASRLGLVDCWMTPFLSITGGSIPSRNALKRRLRPYFDSGLSLIVQLIGHDAGSLGESAARLTEIGVRAVNLNLACPSSTVTGHGSGGALLREPDRVKEIVATVRGALAPEFSLSVKLRAGFGSPDVRTLIQAVEDAELIVFHSRTVQEMYRPQEHGMERLCEAVSCARSPVFGNGDIDSVDSARRMMEFARCDGVALARAFLKQPSLLRRIRGEAAGVSVFEMLDEMQRMGTPRPPLLEFARCALPEDVFRTYLRRILS